MARLIALIILIVPGIIAGYGFKQMRDVLFGTLNHPFPSLAVQFTAGLICFIAGLSFIAGFIFHRDRRKNKVQPRFKINTEKNSKHQ